MQFKEAEAFILNKLKNELSGHLTYHNAGHTEDVVSAVKMIGRGEGLDEAEISLLQAAALFHDTGFLSGPENHEEKSCSLAKDMLPAFGYPPADIETICRLIMATKVPQKPGDLLSEIICDADLDYLGRDDFFIISERLYEELRSINPQLTRQQWNLQQISFLGKHHYFTGTSIQHREEKKTAHLNLLKSKTPNTINER